MDQLTENITVKMGFTLKQRNRIVVLSPGQPSTNPRLLKEVVTLANQGYEVWVLYSFWAKWAFNADIDVKKRYSHINWIEVGGNPFTSRFTFLKTRLRQKIFKALNKKLPSILRFAEIAELRNYCELLSAARRIKATLYIAHNLGALPVAGKAADYLKTKFAFDAEDFHRGQSAEGSEEYRRSVLLEDYWLPKATYVTAASPLISDEYKNVVGVESQVINNVFSTSHLVANSGQSSQPIRLFWFSQTIGPGRGIEDIMAALAAFPVGLFSLTLMGDISVAYRNRLIQMCSVESQQKVQLHIQEPVGPDEVFSVAAEYDIGLALEPGRDRNNQIALSNKIFTYLLAGNAVIFSATPAQKLFYETHPEVGWIYPCGDVQSLAKLLHEINRDRFGLMQRKSKALQLAQERYNWEVEQVKLLNLVEAALQHA